MTDGVLLAQIIQVVGKSIFYIGGRVTVETQKCSSWARGMEHWHLYEKCGISVTCVENLTVLRSGSGGYQLVFP